MQLDVQVARLQLCCGPHVWPQAPQLALSVCSLAQ
jgi:hypothetical protein